MTGLGGTGDTLLCGLRVAEAYGEVTKDDSLFVDCTVGVNKAVCVHGWTPWGGGGVVGALTLAFTSGLVTGKAPGPKPRGGVG